MNSARLASSSASSSSRVAVIKQHEIHQSDVVNYVRLARLVSRWEAGIEVSEPALEFVVVPFLPLQNLSLVKQGVSQGRYNDIMFIL